MLPASLVLIVKDDESKDTGYPVVLVHQDEKEFKKKILHISTPHIYGHEWVIPEKFIKLLEKMG